MSDLSKTLNFQNYDLVIFDLDGTLIDSKIDIAIGIQRIAKKYSLTEISFLEVFQSLGKHPRDLFISAGADELLAEQMVLDFRSNLLKSKLSNTKVYPGVKELLNKFLQSGTSLCIATTKPTSLAISTCHKMGILDYFSLIQGSDNIPHKPNPTVLNICLSYFQAKKAIYIGDTEDDIHAAHNAGVPCIALNHGSRSIQILDKANPIAIVESIGLLEGLFFKERSVS